MLWGPPYVPFARTACTAGRRVAETAIAVVAVAARRGGPLIAANTSSHLITDVRASERPQQSDALARAHLSPASQDVLVSPFREPRGAKAIAASLAHLDPSDEEVLREAVAARMDVETIRRALREHSGQLARGSEASGGAHVRCSTPATLRSGDEGDELGGGMLAVWCSEGPIRPLSGVSDGAC